MRVQPSWVSAVVVVIIVALCCAVVVSPAHAGSAAVVVPPGGSVEGKTVGEYTAEWWRWLVSVPGDQGAQTDTTGERANVNQSGPVFFLAGQSPPADSALTRTFTVPAGRHLLVPLANVLVANGPDPAFSSTQQEANSIITQAVDVSKLFATLDGTAIPDLGAHREASPVNFSISPVAGNALGIPEGTYTDANSDGYWLLLAPLSAGQHTLRFSGHLDSVDLGGFPSPELDVDVTDVITIQAVNPIPLPAQVGPAFGLLATAAASTGLWRRLTRRAPQS